MSATTDDTIYGGRVRVSQPARGYRFSLDALLVAHAAPRVSGPVLDFGTGSGVIALALLFLGKARQVTGIELQPELAALARHNAIANAFETRFTVLDGDVRAVEGLVPAQQAALVVANPPFFPVAAGRDNPHPQEALARREHACSMRDIVHAARYALRGSGRAVLIYPAERLGDLVLALHAENMSLRSVRAVHPTADAPARLVLAEAVVRPATRTLLAAPLILADAAGNPTPEAREITEGPAPSTAK